MSAWTPAMDAALLSRLDAGWSYGRIADYMNVTRNAVAGRTFRLSGKHLHYVRPARAPKGAVA